MAENLPPESAQEILRLGMADHQQGHLEEAEKKYRQILDAEPDHADANHLLGIAASQQGDNETAARLISKAIEVTPGEAVFHNNLGNVLKDLGRTEDAAQSYREAIAIDPELADAHYNIGNILGGQGESDAAMQCYATALRIRPGYIEAHGNLGNILKDRGRLNEAVESYQRALDINPDSAEVLHNLGNALKDLGRPDDALEHFHRALALKPGLGEVHNSLGNAWKEQGRLEDATASYKNAIAINADGAEAWGNLGSILTDLGDLDEAIECYQKALAIRPDHPDAANNYLHTLLYLPDLTNRELFDTCRKTAARLAAHPAAPNRDRTLAPGEKLRIGYLSSDFHAHPVGQNVSPLLGNHDHGRFEIFCYAYLTRPDEVSEQFMRYADHWRPVKGLTDTQVAERINNDRIHIMVYLGGHFDKNRPSVATHRPAPVQVAMHGGTTSALDEMDFWLTDEVLHPPPEKGDTGELFTETLVRLPAFYNYPKTEDAPPASTLPADANSFITFCSFNKPCKMNEKVLDLWSEILRMVPDARLILKFKDYLSVPSIRRKLLGRFETNGIPSDRISLVSADDSFHEHLAHYAQADIALDPFPFAGATTTFQSLWMGVPVVSLLGERFIGRAGGSILVHAGLGDLAVETPQDYVNMAVTLANDLPRLRDLRKALRKQVGASPLCDGPAYARAVEQAFRSMSEAGNGANGGIE